MTKFSSPVPVGSRLTSKFGQRNGTLHAGTDWAGKKPGDITTVHAMAAGRVVGITRDPTLGSLLDGHSGWIVVIDHGILTDKFGSDRTLSNVGHMSRIDVKFGQQVEPGQVLGLTGKTGNVTGVHAHVGLRFNGKWADPDAWLRRKGIVAGKTAIPAPKLVHLVLPGDSLIRIGAKYRKSWRDIAKKNGIKSPYVIYPGQRISL